MEKLIRDFPNYKITVTGEIYSRYKFKTNIVCDEWRPVKPVFDKGVGYFLVTLVHEGARKNQFIHRLLAQHFIPNPENKAHVNHLDGNKQNNALCNLEWATPKENAAHAVRIGLCDQRTLDQGVAVQQFCRSTGQLLAEFPSLHEAGRVTSTAWQNIYKVCRGLRKSAGGFSWAYK